MSMVICVKDQGFGSLSETSPSLYVADPYAEVKSEMRKAYNEGRFEEFLEIVFWLKTLNAL